MSTIFRSWEFRLYIWIFFLIEVKSLCQFWVTIQAQSNVGKSCPWPSTDKGRKAKADWEEAQLRRAPAACWGHCLRPRLLANWFLSQCVHEQNENLRQKMTGNGYPATHSLPGAKSKVFSVERYNACHSRREGGDRGLATITASTLHLPPRQDTQFTSPRRTETKTRG